MLFGVPKSTEQPTCLALSETNHGGLWSFLMLAVHQPEFDWDVPLGMK